MQSNIYAFSLKIQKKERQKVVTIGNQSQHMLTCFTLYSFLISSNREKFAT